MNKEIAEYKPTSELTWVLYLIHIGLKSYIGFTSRYHKRLKQHFGAIGKIMRGDKLPANQVSTYKKFKKSNIIKYGIRIEIAEYFECGVIARAAEKQLMLATDRQNLLNHIIPKPPKPKSIKLGRYALRGIEAA